MKNIPIGEVLKEYGYINEEQLQIALEAQRNDRSKRLGQHLIDLGFITEEHMLKALSTKLGDPLVTVEEQQFDMKAIRLIPKVLAVKYSLIAFKEESGQLLVLTSDPLNFYGLEDVRLVTGKQIKIFLARQQEILSAIEYYYRELDTQSIAKEASTTNSPITVMADLVEFNAEEDDTPVVKLLNSILSRAFNNNASDVHIEPFDEKIIVRMRIDGVLISYLELNKNLLASLIVRIKILSNLDIAEKRIPQDGHFAGVIDQQEMNIRVSLIPTIFGEKAVLRFLNSNTQITYANQFGMNKVNYTKMRKMMEMPHGIIYVTGPTGSGKTTTLYMILEALAKRPVNISTIEDPVEKPLENVNQMQVNNTAGLTFDSGLRSLLRQDPDIIMIGETRDAKTASISVRAAITGHLVVSTLHTNDAISTIVRLSDMGIEPYMVSSSLIGAVAQRLVRVICTYCKKETEATETEKLVVGKFIDTVAKGTGCARCNNTGYKGRMAIHEIIMIDNKVRRMIAKGADIDEIYDYVKKEQHVVTLKDSALQLVEEKITTVEELMKISSYQN